MPKKKATTRKKTTRSRTSHSRSRTVDTAPLFPATLTIEWSDGSTEEMVFADPLASAKGNLNAWAGNKLVRNGKILRVNCNVTQVRG